MEDENKKTIVGDKLFLTIMFLFCVLSNLIFAVIYGKSFVTTERNVFSAVIFLGVIIFAFISAKESGELFYDNDDHTPRFVILICALTICAGIMPMLSPSIWPFLIVFVVLELFSNMTIGILSGSYLLMMTVLLEENGTTSEFALYFLVGVVGVILFKNLDENMNVGFPIIISLMVMAVLLTAYVVIFASTFFSFSLLLMPIMNLAVNFILLLIVISIFSKVEIIHDGDIYMEINDPEYQLLVELKKRKPEEYFRAIHTAYLSERVSNALLLRTKVVKTCAYYDRIWTSNGSKMNMLAKENDSEILPFPKEAAKTLLELSKEDGGIITSKEASVVYICDSPVATIMYVFHKDNNSVINYDELVEKVFARMLEAGELKNSILSIKEIEAMKTLLKKERLYYDFLR